MKFTDTGPEKKYGAIIDNVGLFPHKLLNRKIIEPPKGIALDNVGIYEWKDNCFAKKKK